MGEEHMKIALFGASGEIGTYVYLELTKCGHHVTPVIRNSLGPTLSRSKINFAKIANYHVSSLSQLLDDIDVVINCAIDKSSNSNKKEIIKSNTSFVKNLLEAADQCKIKKFIHLSSIVVLPPLLTDDTIRSNEPSTEKDWYTIAKIMTEKQCLEFPTTGKMKIIVLRPGIVYGARMAWTKLSFHILSETGITLPSNKSTCAAVHPIDIARLIDKIITSRRPPSLIYAINPEKISWAEYYDGHLQGLETSSRHLVQIDEEAPIIPSRSDAVKSIITELLVWIKEAPFWKYLIHIPFILPIGSKVMTRFVYSKKNQGQQGSKASYIPMGFERQLYQSYFDSHKIETGQSIGFKYTISFLKGVNSANLWRKGI